MKILAALISLWTAQAMASPCASVMVYQPAKTCAIPANGVDTSTANEILGATLGPNLPEVDGGHTAVGDCTAWIRQFDKDNGEFATRGVLVEGVTTGVNKSTFGHVTYNFACRYKIVGYLYVKKASVACGIDGGWAYENVGKAIDPSSATNISCLSCDDVPDLAGQVACLQNSVDNVITPRAIELRKSDLQAVQARIHDLFEIQKNVGGLSVDQINSLIEDKKQVQGLLQ